MTGVLGKMNGVEIIQAAAIDVCREPAEVATIKRHVRNMINVSGYEHIRRTFIRTCA